MNIEKMSEKEKLKAWTKLCKTFLDINQWKKSYEMEGYHGD